jgi:hypothetical protein
MKQNETKRNEMNWIKMKAASKRRYIFGHRLVLNNRHTEGRLHLRGVTQLVTHHWDSPFGHILVLHTWSRTTETCHLVTYWCYSIGQRLVLHILSQIAVTQLVTHHWDSPFGHRLVLHIWSDIGVTHLVTDWSCTFGHSLVWPIWSLTIETRHLVKYWCYPFGHSPLRLAIWSACILPEFPPADRDSWSSPRAAASHSTAHVTCIVSHGVWIVVHGVWIVVHGVRTLVHGVWIVVHGVWIVVHGVRTLVHGVWIAVQFGVCSVDFSV